MCFYLLLISTIVCIRQTTQNILYVKNVLRHPKVSFILGDDKNNTNGHYGNLLPNANFKMTMLIKDPTTGQMIPTTDTNHIFTATSDSQGVIQFDLSQYLPPHQAGGDPYDPMYVTYRVEQLDAAPGYKKLAEPFNIMIDRQNEVSIDPNDLTKFSEQIFPEYDYTGAIINDPIKGSLTFFVVDGNKYSRVLSESKFRLYSEKTLAGVPVYDTVSAQTSSEELNFSGLEVGTYYLQELKAPSDYQLIINPIKITVQEKLDSRGKRTGTAEIFIEPTDIQYIERIDLNGDTIKNDLVVKNYERPSLPRTGSSLMLIFLLAGFSLILIASFGYLQIIKKYAKK